MYQLLNNEFTPYNEASDSNVRARRELYLIELCLSNYTIKEQTNNEATKKLIIAVKLLSIKLKIQPYYILIKIIHRIYIADSRGIIHMFVE